MRAADHSPVCILQARGGGAFPEVALSTIERFVAVTSTPAVELPGGTYKSVQFLLLIFKILKTVLIMDPRCLAYHTALHAPIESKHTTPPDLEERGTRTVAHIICLSA